MGRSTYDPGAWATYSSKTVGKSTSAIFTSRRLDDSLNPAKFDFRESRDSAINPQSTPIAVFLDVTGSMGMLATNIAQKGLGVLMGEIVNRKPVTDPHVLFGAIGDANCDDAPIQATQFEGGVEEMTPQLEKLYVEDGGGGNWFESYDFAWVFAALKTRSDSFEKRGKKGYLFTVGDEPPSPRLISSQVKQFFGTSLTESDLDLKAALALVEREWEVFHIMVEQGSHMRHSKAETIQKWRDILGERAVLLSTVDSLAEVIVSIIEVNEGRDKDHVAKSWSGSTAVAVAGAIGGLTVPGSTGSGVVAL